MELCASTTPLDATTTAKKNGVNACGGRSQGLRERVIEQVCTGMSVPQ
jgi:hypothetical protein